MITESSEVSFQPIWSEEAINIQSKDMVT